MKQLPDSVDNKGKIFQKGNKESIYVIKLVHRWLKQWMKKDKSYQNVFWCSLQSSRVHFLNYFSSICTLI